MHCKKILVLDEEEAIRNLLQIALSGTGAEILLAASVKDAFGLAMQHGPLSLLVTDVMMPSMDGIDLAGRLHEQQQVDRVLFLSGYYTGPMLEDRIRSFPRARFLEKPFRIPELIWIVRSMVADTGWEMRQGAARLRSRSTRYEFRQPASPLGRLIAARERAAQLRDLQVGLRAEVTYALLKGEVLRTEISSTFEEIRALERAALVGPPPSKRSQSETEMARAL
jgi:DNA-binding NtrC family response regulator